MLDNQERNISFLKYIWLKIFNSAIYLFICPCIAKSSCIEKSRMIYNLVSDVEAFIFSSYSILKYQDVVHTSFLLKEILLGDDQKAGFEKLDFEEKNCLIK